MTELEDRLFEGKYREQAGPWWSGVLSTIIVALFIVGAAFAASKIEVKGKDAIPRYESCTLTGYWYDTNNLHWEVSLKCNAGRVQLYVKEGWPLGEKMGTPVGVKFWEEADAEQTVP